MRASIRTTACIFAAILCIAAASPGAVAQELKPKGQFGWLGVGTAYEVEKGHFYWVGEFSGTFFSDAGDGGPMHHSAVKCPAYNDLDFNANRNTAAGYCIVMDRDGDQAYLRWRCEGDTHSCKGGITWTGGTGKYTGAKGDNTFTGVTEVTHADGKASGYAVWNR